MLIVAAKALLLIVVANSAPILIQRISGVANFVFPLDFYLTCSDGRRLLGNSKTWRGLVAAMIATTLCSIILHTGWEVGLLTGSLAMLGDAVSSFIKRRAGLQSSAMAIGLDQIPESLFPLIYLHVHWHLPWLSVFSTLLVFILLELALSRVLYYLHIRKRPY